MYGFDEVYDYVDGKADWMAAGLPVEGEEGPFAGGSVVPVATVGVRGTVADALARLEPGAGTLVVVDGGGLALGAVDREQLETSDREAPLLEVMDPVPPTVRPSVLMSSLAGPGERVLVATSDGRLLGQVVPGAPGASVAKRPARKKHDEHAGHDHAGHDEHAGHDGDEHTEHARLDHAGHDHDSLDREFEETMAAVQGHFGDREPTAEELHAFLRDRLVSEGNTPEEAQAFLADIDGDADADDPPALK